MRYCCDHCGEKFDEDNAGWKDVSFWVPYGMCDVKKEEYQMVCPYCESEDICEIYYDDEEDEEED